MGPYGRKMARKSCSVTSKGRLRMMRRLARLGAVPEVVSRRYDETRMMHMNKRANRLNEWSVLLIVALARLSSRFLSVTDNRLPLKTWAWSLLTASCARLDDENNTYARLGH